ncbi:DNRLRE domain-containing protein [Streptomyces sp. NPDC020965]|uniref:DNRLRE domain-containing protein n=1 Tax=Streptomyces sp. NPDC020965 TaxID=3365105 RepID=UPI0037ABA58B
MTYSHILRRYWVIGTCLTLAGALLLEAGTPDGAIAAERPTPPRPTGKPVAGDDTTAAILQARLRGKRVEAIGERTETRTVWANPDGTLTEDRAAGPIRFRTKGGSWSSVDVGLVKRADGRVGSKAHPLGLTLAGATPGRTDAAATRRLKAASPVAASVPLVSLTSGKGRQVELGWRGALPAPRVDGNQATYRDALPHADLVVDATRTGFEQFLKLRSRKAVSQAGTLRMTLSAEGLTAKPAKGGGVTFTDKKTGRAAGTMPAPVMWDTRKNRRTGEHTHRAPVAMTFVQHGDQVDLTLRPSAAFLADPATAFPVTVDPSVNLATTFTTFVQEGYTTDQSTAQDLRIGYNGSQVARSFLRFDTQPVKNQQITAATLKLWNSSSTTMFCGASPWEVWDTNNVSTATRWTAQPNWNRKWATSTQTKGSVTGCAAGWVTANVKTLVQAWATNPHAENIMGIRATHEANPLGWKKFHSRNAASNVPVLSVTYNTLPATATGVALSPSSYNPFNQWTYATSVTPTFSAKVTDPEGAPVKAQFEVVGEPAADGTVYNWIGTSGAVASGATAKLTLPTANKLRAGPHRVRVRAHDGLVYGPWSAYTTFGVNVVRPASPSVSCPGLAQDQWNNVPPGEVTCTFTTTSTDGRGFLWGLNDPTTAQAVNDPTGSSGRPQTVRVTVTNGWHTLYIRTVDSGGLLSGVVAYQFGVGTRPPVLLVPDTPGSLQEGGTDTAAPLLSGVVTAGSRDVLNAEFALFDAAGSALPGLTLPPAGAESGNRVATTVPAGTLTAGTSYQWAMRACTDTACSPWTTKRTFVAKTPVTAPVPQTQSVTLSGAALVDATAPVGAQDCGGTPCAAVQDDHLLVGTPDGISWRTWFKPDLTAIPPGARITNARLKLHRVDCADGETCEEPAATLHDLADPWGPQQSGQDLAAATSEAAYEADDELPTPLPGLNLGSLIDAWRSGDENHGLSLRSGDETTPAPGVVYHSSRTTEPAKRPQLVIDYIAAVAPGAAEDIKTVAADGGLLATWNTPADTGSSDGALTYTVVAHQGATEVFRTTTPKNRVTVPGLTNGADHTITITAASPYGTSPAVVTAPVKPQALADRDTYTQAVRDYAAARAGLLKGTYTTLDQATASSPHGAKFRALLAEQAPELNRQREAFARHNRHYSSVTTTFNDLLVGPGPNGTVVVRGRITERSVLTHTNGSEEPEEGELPGRFVFDQGILRVEADDDAVETTMPQDEAAVRAAHLAEPETVSIDDVPPVEEDPPLVELDSDGMIPVNAEPIAEPPARAAPDRRGTVRWALQNLYIDEDYDQDCTNFVSKALNRGGKMKIRRGGRQNPSRWFRNNIGTTRRDSLTWSVTQNHRDHLKKHRAGKEISQRSARQGDVIFAYYKNLRRWNHAGIVWTVHTGQINILQHGSSNSTTLSKWLRTGNISKVSIVRPGKRS